VQIAASLFNRLTDKIFKSNFVKNLFIYSSGALFLKGIGFFLIPLYTSLLAPSDYGILELLTTIATVLGILFSFGLSQVVFIEYFHLDAKGKREIIQQITNAYTYLALPLFALAGVLLVFFGNAVFEQNVGPFIVALVLLQSFFSFYQNTFFALLQIVKKAFTLTVNKIVIGVFTLALNLYLVYYLRMGVTGILITNLAVLLISLCYPAYLYFFHLKPTIKKVDWPKTLGYLKLGFPFILSSLCFWGLSGMDRWLILYFLGEASVGIFSVAYKFSSVFEPLIIAPVLGVYTPFIFEKLARKDFRQHKVMMVLVILFFFALLAFASQFLAQAFVNIRYHDSLSLIPYLVGGFAFYFLSQLLGAPILYYKKSSLLVLNVALAAAFNLVFNIVFIRYYGLQGAGMAYLISNFAWFVLAAVQNSLVIKRAEKTVA
jgi:O-antigen/teichoic acid export membrane protein